MSDEVGEETEERPRITASGCLWALVKLPFQLALGIARMGVMLAVFVVGALAAGIAGAGFGYGVDVVGTARRSLQSPQPAIQSVRASAGQADAL